MIANEQDLQLEIELLRQIGQGNREALAELYDRFAGILYHMAARVLNDAAEAEDVLQEVFLQIWDRADQYDHRLGRPFNWALTLTRNKAIDRLRSSQRRHRLIEEATMDAAPAARETEAPHERMDGLERATAVRKVLAQLPADQRQAIEMAFFGGLSQTEIAEALRQPLGTIKARIRRGMMRLRDELQSIELTRAE